MELKAINLAPYKKAYTIALIFCILSVGASLLIVRQGYAVFANFAETEVLKDVMMYGMIGAAVVFSIYQSKQKAKLSKLLDFDEKLALYQKIFRSRIWWHILACFISAFILFLTARNIFLYLALFDLFLMLIGFPNKLLFKKELNEEELIVH